MERMWLVELRKKKKMSQEDVAEKMNTTQQTISRWEIGERNPKPHQAQKLAEILKFKWTKFYE